MRKKIIVKGPCLSCSGYGQQSRFALQALRKHEDIFDIYVLNTNWGQTGWIPELSEERKWIDTLIVKTNQYLQMGNPQFDISLQITIPAEFQRMAPINIGYTAAMETDKVAPEWLLKCNEMDKIIVPSEHSKKTLTGCSYTGMNNQTGQQVQVKCQVPVEVCSFPFKNLPELAPESKIDLLGEVKTPFNFLVVSQWGPRKNLVNTIVWFLQEFKNNENVGMVLKIHRANTCMADRLSVEAELKEIRKMFAPDSKAKLYLLHGYLTEQEMNSVYASPKIKAFVNIAHGEGFGLPMLDAVENELPVATIEYGGQLDFLKYVDDKDKTRKGFLKIDHEIKNVQQEALWDKVINPDMTWAFAKESSFKTALKALHGDIGRFKGTARKVKQEFLKNPDLHDKFCDLVWKKKKVEVEDFEDDLIYEVNND